MKPSTHRKRYTRPTARIVATIEPQVLLGSHGSNGIIQRGQDIKAGETINADAKGRQLWLGDDDDWEEQFKDDIGLEYRPWRHG